MKKQKIGLETPIKKLRKRAQRAENCERCRSHHKSAVFEMGWYCGVFHAWDCSKSLVFKDYSHKRKGDY